MGDGRGSQSGEKIRVEEVTHHRISKERFFEICPSIGTSRSSFMHTPVFAAISYSPAPNPFPSIQKWRKGVLSEGCSVQGLPAAIFVGPRSKSDKDSDAEELSFECLDAFRSIPSFR